MSAWRTGVGIGLFGILAFMAAPLSCAGDAAKPAAGKAVAYRTVGAEDFQSFVKNWDDKKEPVLYAVIRTPAEWDAVFHPAPVMGKPAAPFAPDAKAFEKDQLLVVARVMFPPDPGAAKAFQVETVAAVDEELTLSYRLAEPGTPKSFTVKNYLGVWVPKRAFKRVVFIENGKRAGVLDLSRGQWSVPAMAPEPPAKDAAGGK